MKPRLFLILIIAFSFCFIKASGQQLVRTYTFGNNVNCNVPDGSALSYSDVENKTSISLNSLNNVRILEGKIFFAGNGFRRAVLMEPAICGKKIFETEPEFDLYDRITIGTKVIFKGCIFLNADGTKTSKKTKVLIISQK